jgi:GGDEF domain-containing protein
VQEQSHVDRPVRRIELSAEELSLLLGPDRFGGSDEPHAGAPDAPATALIAAPTPVGGPAPEVPAAPIDTAPRTTHATPYADAIQPPTGAARHLGDADLVQAILEGAPNFEQLLLRAIRERTGEDLARIVTGAAGDAMVVAGTGTHVGEGRALVVPIAPDARAAWAAWYRRWSELASLAATHAPRGAWDDTTGFPSWPRMRPQVAHRIAAARLRREAVHVSVLRVEDIELWNRRSQVLVDAPFLARVAAAIDADILPGDEMGRLDDGGFVLVSERTDAPARIAGALRGEIAKLPGDGPRSLAVRVGTATAPWDATEPQPLLELAACRAAADDDGR